MIVCHCTGTTDRQIRDALVCGARCRDDVGRHCGGAGQACGGCRPVIEALVHQRANERSEAGPLSSVA